MGKADDLRALREARYAANKAAPSKDPKTAKRAAAMAALTRATAAATRAAGVGSDIPVCGHRSIGNKSCIREKGHELTGTKSHRYAKD